MPPKSVTLAAFLPTQLKPPEQLPETAQLPNAQPRPQRCRCEGPFDLCWRYPATIPNAVCKQTWDRLLAPFQFKGREWTIIELRSLWPHTVQALNERLQKGRLERTLKEDLQDDLQVLVDLIQYSCKPHPRPPRAGMKTLIVQGRILAEAIAQDALFQLDPADRAAPRPERDLVDLINRLRDHHPNSLLAPALHVLRTLGNTAVHLDRDSARLTDGEIGDAAAVCCRFVVLVVDAYMQMCANLHRHEETEAALAQPLLEAPVAPIPAPNVLLRPRDPTPLRPSENQEIAITTTTTTAVAASVASTSATTAVPPPMPTAWMAARASQPPAVAAAATSVVTDRILLVRQGPAGTGVSVDSGPSGTCNDGRPTIVGGITASGRDDGSNTNSTGRRRSFPGSPDGHGRVPYSLVSNDRYAALPHVHVAASSNSGGGCGDVDGIFRPKVTSQVNRGWWPPAEGVEATAIPPTQHVAAALPSPGRAEASGHGLGAGLGPMVEQWAASQTHVLPQPVAMSTIATNLHPGHPLPYGMTGGPWSAAASVSAASCYGGQRTTDACVGIATATPALSPQPPLPLTKLTGADQLPSQLAPDSSISAFGTGSAVSSTSISVGASMSSSLSPAASTSAVVVGLPLLIPPGQNDSWTPLHYPAGGSPRRFPISLTSNEAGDHTITVSTAATGITVRGGSPKPARHVSAHQLHQWPASNGATAVAAPGSGSGNGPGALSGSHEVSKRLLQLCAVAQTPATQKVEQLLQAGASLTFTDKSGMTALHLACYWCHSEAVRLLLDRQPSAAAAADREGRTPLWVASQRGHVELVEILLALTEGAMQVDIANAAGVTPLRVAAAQGHSQVVETLLRAGANVELADKDGFTPLYVAAARSQLEVVRLLLGASAPVDRTDKAQRTPLWAALHPGGAAKAEASPERRAAVVRVLLAGGADVHLLADARDREYCWQLLAQSIAAGE